MMPDLEEYTKLWRDSDVAVSNVTGAAPRDVDLNVRMPRPFHFGPPPTGWGRELEGYVTELGSPTGPIGADPTRQIATADPNMVIVRTWWVQRALNGLHTRLSIATIREDGQAGPQTMSSLDAARQRVVAVRRAVQVPLRNERPTAATGPWASHVAVDARVEAYLAQSVADPIGSGVRPAAAPSEPDPGVTVGPVTFEDEQPAATSGSGGTLLLVSLFLGGWYLLR